MKNTTRWGYAVLALVLVGCGGVVAPAPEQPTPEQADGAPQPAASDAIERYVRAVCACGDGFDGCHDNVRGEVEYWTTDCLEQWSAVYERTCSGRAAPGEVSAQCGGEP